MKTTNIYVLLDPDRKCHGYIGKADDPEKRFKSHSSSARNDSRYYVHRWIRKIWKNGKELLMAVQHRDVKIQDWQKLERQTIKLYSVLGWKLKNTATGGQGAMTGRKHTEETKRKIGLASKGNKYGLGHKHSKSFCIQVSKRFKGKQKSGEHKRKIGLVIKGKLFLMKLKGKYLYLKPEINIASGECYLQKLK